jgi:hypothetical protein
MSGMPAGLPSDEETFPEGNLGNLSSVEERWLSLGWKLGGEREITPRRERFRRGFSSALGYVSLGNTAEPADLIK